jgi:PPOX class probable F420-dependent enzyme
MAMKLPEAAKKLLTDKAYGHVFTYNPKGEPQVTMVWMDVEGDQPVFNTAEGRLKPRNLRSDPRIIVTVQDRTDPQAYLTIYGRATLTEQGADANIDKLAKRFLGVDKYPYRQPGEKRILVKIDVQKIGGLAPGMQPWK